MFWETGGSYLCFELEIQWKVKMRRKRLVSWKSETSKGKENGRLLTQTTSRCRSLVLSLLGFQLSKKGFVEIKEDVRFSSFFSFGNQRRQVKAERERKGRSPFLFSTLDAQVSSSLSSQHCQRSFYLSLSQGKRKFENSMRLNRLSQCIGRKGGWDHSW